MHQYRVTKYDPQYRVGGVYTRDEWTSVSDVGNIYDGKTFTMAEYEQAERQHVDFLCTLAERDHAFPLTIRAYEQPDDSEHPSLEGHLVTRAALPALLRDILREECWCRLEGKDFFIHFGYEYYLYVGCSFTQEGITQLAREHSLFADPMVSPYHPDAEDEDISPDLRPMTAIYLTRGDKLLLLYRMGSRVVGNSYTGSAGGHIEPEEYNCARACVLRELREETGLTPDALDGLAMRYVTMRLKGGEIRQNYYFFAELREGFDPPESSEGRLQWFSIDRLAALPMPVTAKQVIQHYIAEGRYTQLLYGGISTADGAIFTPMEEF